MMHEPAIKIECANCGQHIEAPDELAGQEIECPGCSQLVPVRRKLAVPPARAAERIEGREAAERRKDFFAARELEISAGRWGKFSQIAMGLAILLLIVGFLMSDRLSAVAGGLLVASFFFGLMAELGHIRALLLRQLAGK